MSRAFLIAVFALSLAASLWFNFASAHINNAGVADASEYMRLAMALGHFLWHDPGFYFSASPELKQALGELKGFSQAGIVFPGYVLLCWLLSGSPHAYESWQAPIFGQCVLAAGASVFLALTGNLLWGRTAGMICGVLAALYPAFIVNSGRLYSESFATSLTAVILFSLCRGFAGKSRGKAEIFLLGASLAMVQLTRSLMVVLSLFAYPLIYFQDGRRQSWKKLVLLFLGMAVILVPWLCLQKAVFDKASLVVDRVGNYNLYVGTNYSIKGWLSYPYPDVTSIEKKSSAAVLYDNVRAGPLKFMKLMADKPYRLFKFPWNDFRTSIGGVNFYWQVAFHQFLLLLCGIGLAIGIFSSKNAELEEKPLVRARLFLLLYLIFHLLYWLFITVPRYNMTAMPAMILFAGAGGAALIELVKTNRKRGVLLIVASLALFLIVRQSNLGALYPLFGNAVAASVFLSFIKLLLSILFFLLLYKCFNLAHSPLNSRAALMAVALPVCLCVTYPARANGRIFEWQSELQKGEKITQEIVVDKTEALKEKQVYLLLDSEGSSAMMEKGSVSINGIALDGPLIPGISLTQDFAAVKKDPTTSNLYLECEWIYDCMTAPAEMSNADLRQWFWLPLPPEVVHSIASAGKADIAIEAKTEQPARIFGTFLPGKKSTAVGSLDSSSWEKAFYGVESDKTLTDPRYDLGVDFRGHDKASFANAQGAVSSDLSHAAGTQTGAYMMLLVAAAKPHSGKRPEIAAGLPAMLQLDIPLARDGKLEKNFSIGIKSPDSLKGSDMWMVRLKGQSKSSTVGACVEPIINVVVEEKDGKSVNYPCRWMPRCLPSSKELRTFDYCFPLMPSLLPGKITAVNISFEGRQQPGTLNIENLALEVVPLPLNPLVHKTSVF